MDGCSVCDSNIISCDVCSADGAQFDTTSFRCVVSEPRGDRTSGDRFYLSEPTMHDV